MKFKQKGRDEQCEPDAMDIAAKVCSCCGVDPEAVMKAFCKPRIKVGTEWVTKGQNIVQSMNAVGGIARAIFDRLFKWLIEKCNETLIDSTMKKNNFVAVLDIAGFEMFEYNGFEQISINFVNEKLQQFFNHHMFVVEQEEYVTEGIDWVIVDFGMDLAACIIMFEKPMGVWAILEEESNFPKATDKTFEDKIKAGHLGKSPPFAKPQSKTDKNAHFAIIHYAGIVSYNVTGWLEKNKDPVNDTVVEILKNSSDALLVSLWADHPGQPLTSPDEGGKKKKKKGASKTVSSVYLVQLAELMSTLHSTEPHFIRCIVPNTHKKPLEVEPPLIMHQLTCNGVLEGIRICMRGFPNRMLYPDYKSRYQILGAAEIATAKDNKEGVYALMDKIAFDRARYRLGHTKVFFRAGALAGLEEARDDLVLKWVRMTQGQVLKIIRGRVYEKKRDQRELIKIAQRNFRKYMSLRDWGWFVIIQKTRGLIGLPNPEEELRLLEEKANATYGEYKKALDVTAELEQSNVQIQDEIKDLTATLAKAQGDISQYTERQAKATAEKAELESELSTSQKQLAAEEASRIELAAEVKKHSGSINVVKKDIQDLELAIQKVETEKANRDHTISSLNDEIAQQDEVINKLNKEKKHISENAAKSSEDLQVAEDKFSHLTSVKNKLESTLDDIESSVDKEKRSRGNLEKERRKAEGELKLAQDQVGELERDKRNIENALVMKEKDIQGLALKLEDEQAIVGKSQKNIKEIQGRIEELEQELEAERQARAKAERQRSDLAREIEDLGHRLDEAGGATNAQIELNKKREAELNKLRKDLEESNINHESLINGLKKKQQDAIQEMNDQIDQLMKMKAKVDKDKSLILHEIDDIRAATDEVNRSKASIEKSIKALQATYQETRKKIDEASMVLGDFEKSKRKMACENSDLLRTAGELANNLQMLNNAKSALAARLEEVKQTADNESRERSLLLGKFRNLEHAVDGAKDQFDEISNERENVLRITSKAEAEAQMWRQKYETDAVAKAEELEISKMKSKVDSLTRELDQSQKDTRNASSDLFKVKSAYEECVMQLDEVRRENKTLSNEAKDLMDQISEGGHSIHEINKICKRLEAEKMELEAALSEAEATLEQEENKVLRIQLELNQVQQETVRRLSEKDEEFMLIKKNFTKAVENMQAALETESKGKAEALRMKKKLEGDVGDLEIALEHANASSMETQSSIKKYQGQIREAQMKLEEENAQKAKAHDALVAAERKANASKNALEESRSMIEQSDRNRRAAEQDLADTNEELAEAI